jgi:hypothetical protein
MGTLLETALECAGDGQGEGVCAAAWTWRLVCWYWAMVGWAAPSALARAAERLQSCLRTSVAAVLRFA